ncbi:MAG: hypothetical protein RLZZ574_1555, partial [Cyanobacteriota bacterium]
VDVQAKITKNKPKQLLLTFVAAATFYTALLSNI